MSKLFIDSVSAPEVIKSQLKVFAQDIELTREVTKGGNGYLFFGENRILKKHIAMKFYYWGGDHRFHAEPSTLAKITSPHILPVHNAGLLDGEWAYFVTPYCSKGDMDDVIARSELENLKAIDRTCQILTGVGALHEQRFLHRDLKPANVYVGDEDQSIIGDFGSIKHMPEKLVSIPASSHAVLYRPPESIETNSYGFAGDIYQCGLILYQLLGGYFPYDEVSWLSKSERRTYDYLGTNADKSIYSDQCLKSKILKGKVVDISSLPPWVPDKLKRTIRKAVHIDPRKRFVSASAFHVHLNNIRSQVPDWALTNSVPVLRAKTSFRVCSDGDQSYVQKSRNGSHWRRDNSFQANSLADLVAEIDARA